MFYKLVLLKTNVVYIYRLDMKSTKKYKVFCKFNIFSKTLILIENCDVITPWNYSSYI